MDYNLKALNEIERYIDKLHQVEIDLQDRHNNLSPPKETNPNYNLIKHDLREVKNLISKLERDKKELRAAS